jgi:anti-anti-sigma regulatory factor
METVALQLAINPKRVETALEEARAMLDKAEGELVIDFTTVPRLSARDMRALEELLKVAEGKGVRLVLRGFDSGLYKTLKLAKLSSRLAFAS